MACIAVRMSLLPSRLHVSSSPDEPRVVDIETEEGATTFDALGSETARAILAAIYEEPKTPPELRETVGSSLQNVHYHVDRLESAGLVEPAGTGYSAKGTEMTVYAPASEAVVLFAGRESDGSRLRDAVKQLFGLVLVVVLSTGVFAVVHDRLTGEPESTAGPMSTQDAASAAEAAAGAATGLDPAVAFFLGGCVVVVAAGLWWLLRPRVRSWWSSR